MPYALRFDGVNDVVSIPSGMTGNAGTQLYTMRIKSGPAGITLPASGLAGIIGTAQSTTSSGLIVNSTGQLRIYTAGTNRYGSTGQLIFTGVPFDYTLTHLANGNWDIYNNLTNSPTGESGTFTTSTSWVAGTNALNQFGRSNSNNTVYLQGDIASIEVTGLTNAQDWEADLSGGAGTTLPTVSGTNQGTLVNFTVPGCWIFYSAGATYQLTALGGTFTYSGQTAALNRGFKLAAQGGTYSYTGASANLSYTTATTYRLDALGAAYSYLGASASLLRDFKLTAQGGAYSYAGSDAVLRRGFKLAANGGAYNYAGADASLTYVAGPTVYRLTALGVTYVYSGADATLTATGVIPVANPSAFINRARVAGAQTVPAKVGSLLVNNARIDGMLINKGRLAQ